MENPSSLSLRTNTIDLKIAHIFSELIHDLASLIAAAFAIILTLFILLYSNFPILERWALLIPLMIGMVIPRIALSCFLVAIPIFGNRPGSEQAFYLMLTTCSLVFGLSLSRFLPSEERFYSIRLPHSPLHLLLSFYVLVSFLSLSSLPINEFIYHAASQIPSVYDFHATSSFLINFIRSTEETLSYSFLSVIWTFLSLHLAKIMYRYSHCDPFNMTLFAVSILCGLLITLITGLLSYYGYIDLTTLRSLDPVVNPEGREFRLQSFFGHSGWFAEYVTLAVPFVIIFLLAPISFAKRLLFILSILLLGEISLILSFQRGGWVSYPLTLFVVWGAIYVYRKFELEESNFLSALKGSLLKVLVSIPLTLFLTTALVFILSRSGIISSGKELVVSRYLTRFSEIQNSSDRTSFVKAGFLLGKLHPFLGAGSESFAYQFNKEFNTPGGNYYRQLSLPLFGSSHNVYMQTFSGKGLAGLWLLILILFYTVWASIRSVVYENDLSIDKKLILLTCAAFCVAFMIYGNVQELFYVQTLQFLFFATLGLAVASLERSFLKDRPLIRLASIVTTTLILFHFSVEIPNLSNLTSPPSEYGCYAQEKDEIGNVFSWCGVRSKLQATITSNTDSAMLNFRIRVPSKDQIPQNSIITIKGPAITPIQIKLAPGTTQQVSIPIQQENKPLNNIITLEFTNGSYFVPAYKDKTSRDYRTLSFQIYL